MAEGPQTQSPRSVSVYALSKGKGVPPETRDTFDKARALLQQLQRENRVSRVHESRIGIEGETRVCAEFADERVANETIQKLRDLFRGVPLSNVKEEPCRKAE